MSYRLQIMISETLYTMLTQQARQTGQSLEVLATTWLTAAANQFAHDPLDAFLGAFDSGGCDWADNHARYLGQMSWDTHPPDQHERHIDG